MSQTSLPAAREGRPQPDDVIFPSLAAKDLERLTGLSAAVQRVWRNRGQLDPRRGPHARFDVYDAAAVAIRYRLSVEGRSPAETIKSGADYAPSLLYYVFLETRDVCEALAASEERLDEIEAGMQNDDELVARLTRFSFSQRPDRFLIGVGTDLTPTSEPQSAFDQLRSPSGIFIDLLSLAQQFGIEAREPLVTLLYDGVTRDSRPRPYRRLLKP